MPVVLHHPVTTPAAIHRLVRPLNLPHSAPLIWIDAEHKRWLVRAPLLRTMRRGFHGDDVRMLQRALIRAKVRPVKLGASGDYGAKTARQVARIQHAHHWRITGQAGPRVFGSLVRHRRYDTRGVLVLRQLFLDRAAAARAPAPFKPAEKIIAYTRWAEAHAGAMHYSQGSTRGTYERRPFYLPQSLDCSMYATNAYAEAGLPDPNGFGYNGFGYTGTQLLHGTRVYGVPRVGDLVFYGWPVVSHVAIATGGGYVSSMGSEIGPLREPWNYRPVTTMRRYF